MNIVETIVNSGLYSTQGEPYFSARGCDVRIHPDCNGLAGTVEDASGYASLADAQALNRKDNLYTFRICGTCNYYAQYGE